MADLAHWQYDTFQAIWRQRRLGKMYVTFVLDSDGKVAEMRAVDLADFTRKPEPADTAPGIQLAPAELERYTGTFASSTLPVSAEVQVVGGQLKLTVPGQVNLHPRTHDRHSLPTYRPGVVRWLLSGLHLHVRPGAAGDPGPQPAPQPSLTLSPKAVP